MAGRGRREEENVRRLIVVVSATALMAGTVVTPTMASRGSGNKECDHGQAANKNPHCNGGKPGGHPYQGNGCPSFLEMLGMCTRP